MYRLRDEFFLETERHFAFLHDSNYRATSRKVCLGPGTEMQVIVKLFCLKTGPAGTHMCMLKHAVACRSTRIFSKGLHMLGPQCSAQRQNQKWPKSGPDGYKRPPFFGYRHAKKI